LKNNIPYFSFDKVPVELKTKWKSAISEVIDNGQFIGGKFVEKFEKEWASNIKASNAISVGNGLDGLVLALRTLGIGKGSKVAVPAHTFIASWLAIDIVGATPIGVDVNNDGLLNLDKLFNLKPFPDAVMPVHLHGAMVDMYRLTHWAKKNHILVIEDASQSHLAKSNNKFAGTWGDAGVFSLYPSKNLGALGDAGIITFKDPEHSILARSLRSYGADPKNKYKYLNMGYNSRLDTVQASVLSINIRYLKVWNKHRISLGEIYCSNLNPKLNILQNSNTQSVRHHFPILVDDPDKTTKYLLKHNVYIERHYPEAASDTYNRLKRLPRQSFPIAQKISRKTISLPVSQWHSISEIIEVCDIINIGVKKGIIN